MLWNRILLTRQCDSEQAASIDIALTVTTNAWIVPVRDDQRSIRSHADIRRTEPLIASSIQDVIDLGLVASSIVGHRIAADYVWTGVAMDELIDESLGQIVAFVDQNAGR